MFGIELIARGVILSAGRVLLARARGAAHTFLPGGHVEPGEAAREALRRELVEELGLDATVGSCLGAVEHAFVQKGRRVCEVNLVFRTLLPNAIANEAPSSKEAGLEFLWCSLADLEARRLEPSPLRRLIPEWTACRESALGWGSTLEPEPWQT